jgi:hypothetical protein
MRPALRPLSDVANRDGSPTSGGCDPPRRALSTCLARAETLSPTGAAPRVAGQRHLRHSLYRRLLNDRINEYLNPRKQAYAISRVFIQTCTLKLTTPKSILCMNEQNPISRRQVIGGLVLLC